MTELEKHVTDLETSKKLFEILGDRKTCFYWEWYEEETNYGELTGKKYWTLLDGQNAQDINYDKENQYENGKRIIYPCYLATELLEIFLKLIQNHAVDIVIKNGIVEPYAIYYVQNKLPCANGKDIIHCISSNNLTQSLAKMTICLHENKLYDFKKEVNND